jgi:hypothetical protein
LSRRYNTNGVSTKFGEVHFAAMQEMLLNVVLAQQGDDFEDLPPEAQVAIIAAGVLFMLVALGISVFILYLFYNLLNALPPEYRLMEPPMVFLLLIPCFNLVWNFFVFARISKSYENFFRDHDRPVGDCGAGLGITYSICAVLVSIPCLNYVTIFICGPAMIVLIIIYLVQLHGLKKEIPSLAGSSEFL